MQYHAVTLLVPVERGDNLPYRWDWQSLLDTVHPVVVEADVPQHERDLPPECLTAMLFG